MTQSATPSRKSKSPTQSARGKAAAAKKRSVVQAAPSAGKNSGNGARNAGNGARDAGKRAKAKASTAKPKPKSLVSSMLRKAALKALKIMGRKALSAGAETARGAADRAVEVGRGAADRAVEAGRGALDGNLSKRLPIFASIDVAVPPVVAWKQWMTFESFTEGVHRIEDVERDGDRLYGRTREPLGGEWEAEIVDEREQQAFAWRSVEGSDCAGLATFHQLSDRLTRIELDLDVVPTNPAETLALSLHIAHRRADTELRRFKARVEFINPDVYEAELTKNGSRPAGGDDRPDHDD